MRRDCPGLPKRGGYFEGWYFKQQNKTEMLALIPAFHTDRRGRATASLQVVTDNQTCSADFPAAALYYNRKRLFIRLGGSTFTEQGCSLDVKAGGCVLQGALRFGPFIPPAYDIMGPFRFLPWMECRHSVLSLSHRVDGDLTFNGRRYLFENGLGYLEGDRGTSFPRRYLWTQYCWEGNSIMLSVADIPLGTGSFVGCIGTILLDGKEYRIATYRGVKLLHIGESGVLLRQKDLVLKIKLIKGLSHPLYAPHQGEMNRIIRESPSCSVQYSCFMGDETLFDFVTKRASFEGNWGKPKLPA